MPPDDGRWTPMTATCAERAGKEINHEGHATSEANESLGWSGLHHRGRCHAAGVVAPPTTPQHESVYLCGDGSTPGSFSKETTKVKISKNLSVMAALLVPLLAIGLSGLASRAAAPGPTVPFHDSYPITVAAGDYNLVY